MPGRQQGKGLFLLLLPASAFIPAFASFSFNNLTYKHPMKKLRVTLELEMSVPEDWALVETSEGTPVVALPDGTFMDIAVEPLFASDPEDTWASTDSDEVLNDILDMVESESVTYELITH